MAYSKYIRKREEIERIRVIVPKAAGSAVLSELHDDDWRVIRLGPYTNKAMFPKCDMTRSLFVAERVIKRTK
jgi:hypothetical protein